MQKMQCLKQTAAESEIVRVNSYRQYNAKSKLGQLQKMKMRLASLKAASIRRNSCRRCKERTAADDAMLRLNSCR